MSPTRGESDDPGKSRSGGRTKGRKTGSKRKEQKVSRNTTQADAGARKPREAEPAKPANVGAPDRERASAGPAKALKDFAETTSEVVQKAASILEEEIAAGIVAAKEVEDHFIDVNEFRIGDPSEVNQRVRRDVHDVVDIVIDIFNAGLRSIGGLANRVVKIREVGDRSKRETASGSPPVLSSGQPVKAGTVAEISMLLENESKEGTVEFSFVSSDLVSSSSDDRIEAALVGFSPAPLSLAPKQSAKMLVTVEIPSDARAGHYTGVVQATELQQIRALIEIVVE